MSFDSCASTKTFFFLFLFLFLFQWFFIIVDREYIASKRKKERKKERNIWRRSKLFLKFENFIWHFIWNIESFSTLLVSAALLKVIRWFLFFSFFSFFCKVFCKEGQNFSKTKCFVRNLIIVYRFATVSENYKVDNFLNWKQTLKFQSVLIVRIG